LAVAIAMTDLGRIRSHFGFAREKYGAKNRSRTCSAIARETRICPPCAAFMIRAVRLIVPPK
jgi:hypothetical protein